MEVLDQLNLAMAYIEEHIDDDIDLADIASVTSYSPYHFGRLFYYIADMPLTDYLRRRKLSHAAIKLQSGCDRIIDLAVQYGYDSADSFSRAFTRQHGVTPFMKRQKDPTSKCTTTAPTDPFSRKSGSLSYMRRS